MGHTAETKHGLSFCSVPEGFFPHEFGQLGDVPYPTLKDAKSTSGAKANTFRNMLVEAYV